MAKVVIGVDPHKRINAVVVLNSRAKVLASGAVRERRAGVPGAPRRSVGSGGLERGRLKVATGSASMSRNGSSPRVNGSWMSRRGVPRWCGCSRGERPQERRHRRALDRVGRSAHAGSAGGPRRRSTHRVAVVVEPPSGAGRATHPVCESSAS